MELPAKLQTQSADFDPAQWERWSYKQNAPREAAYSPAVSYVLPHGTIEETEKKNHAEAVRAGITSTGFSLTADGIYVGIVRGKVSAAEPSWERIKFQEKVPLDDSISGDQPPIAGRYPRAVFPASGWHAYGLLLSVNPEDTKPLKFGTSFEEHSVRVHEGATRSSIVIPPECPCDKEIRAAIANFHEGSGISIPQGEYRVSIEVERSPIVSLRIDGGRPFSSQLLREGAIDNSLPVMDLYAPDFFKSISFGGQPDNERRSPLERGINKGHKYAEIPMMLPLNGPENPWSLLREVRLKTGPNDETAELTYRSLERPESVAEVKVNPNQGLVEIQIDRVAKIHSIKIEYIPGTIPNPYAREADSFRSVLEDRAVITRGSFALTASSPVNIGRTELAKPKIGPAAPTTKAEWDGHVHTFRFCLTNTAIL